jgi:pullulanase
MKPTQILFGTLLTILITMAFLHINAKAGYSQPENVESKIMGASAHWVALDRFIWAIPENATRFELHYSFNSDIEISGNLVRGSDVITLSMGSELSPEKRDKFRHISDWPVFTATIDESDAKLILKSQLIAVAFDDSDNLLMATHVQTPGVIDDLFYFEGSLGPDYSGNEISVNVWAPTAQYIRLNLYDAEKNLLKHVDPLNDMPLNGVWEFSGDSSWDKLFYRYEVTVYHHANSIINIYEVTDPYSVSHSTDSRFSQFADLKNDETLKPTGWDDLKKELPRPVDITLYEAHIRDFSYTDFTVPEPQRGTYMAFTHNGKNGNHLSDGMAYLSRLAEAGLTHLHLLPLNDITTIREDRNQRIELDDPYNRICELIAHERFIEGCEKYGDQTIREVFEMLSANDPITLEIQEPYNRIGHHEAVNRSDGLASYDGFNWGYDPFHFNSVEGSYSTNPEGVQRILELREMVKALHEIGLLIVVDVVYNHTSSAGLGERSVLDRVVPGYYMRRDPLSGDVETSTCCQNTAAEFAMMEKLMVDSMVLWAEMYKIDSFRFDLMGHHPRYVMENIQQALTNLTLDEHGVDGANIYIYGEGWNFGEVANDRIFDQATQFNMAGTGIGNFNDRQRDAIRGGMYSDWGRNQGFTSGQYLFPNGSVTESNDEQLARLLDYADRIRVGMTGNLKTYPYINRSGERVLGGEEGIGYTLMPQESVNYIDKHDNESLWDNTQPKLPMDMSTDDRVRIHMLSNAMLNFGQGIPFYQMGTDILRSKSLDRNSYDSGDWFNQVDFTLETHNWGIGLPPSWDNRARWEDMKPHLSNPKIQVNKEHMLLAHNIFLDQLRIRYSSPLFRLENADDVHKRVAFHNTGPDQQPGLIIMSISDGSCAGADLDPELDGIMVLYNADIKTVAYNYDFTGFELHPIQKNGADGMLHDLHPESGSINIPPLSSVVLVRPQQDAQGSFICNIN